MIGPLANAIGPLGRAVGAVAAFVPTDIAGLKAWYKADAGLWQDSAGTTPATLDTDPVGRWSDQSGQGNHVIQATAGKRPLLRTALQNALPGLRFDGIDDFLNCTLTSAAQPITVFTVAKARITGVVGNVLATSSLIIGATDGGSTARWRTYAGGGAAISAGSNSTVANVWTGLFSGAASLLRQNGTQVGATTNIGTGGVGTTLAIGSTPAGTGQRFDGDVFEVLLYTGDKTANFAAIEAYLKTRWGTP